VCCNGSLANLEKSIESQNTVSHRPVFGPRRIEKKRGQIWKLFNLAQMEHDQNKSKGRRTFHCKVKKQTKNSTDILCIMYLEYLILQYHMGILNSSVPNLVSKLVLTLI